MKFEFLENHLNFLLDLIDSIRYEYDQLEKNFMQCYIYLWSTIEAFLKWETFPLFLRITIKSNNNSVTTLLIYVNKSKRILCAASVQG